MAAFDRHFGAGGRRQGLSEEQKQAKSSFVSARNANRDNLLEALCASRLYFSEHTYDTIKEFLKWDELSVNKTLGNLPPHLRVAGLGRKGGTRLAKGDFEMTQSSRSFGRISLALCVSLTVCGSGRAQLADCPGRGCPAIEVEPVDPPVPTESAKPNVEYAPAPPVSSRRGICIAR